MQAIKNKSKRNKFARILFLPALIFIFLIGFGLYSKGDNKRNHHRQQKLHRKDDVTLIPIFPEEEKQQTVYA